MPVFDRVEKLGAFHCGCQGTFGDDDRNIGRDEDVRIGLIDGPHNGPFSRCFANRGFNLETISGSVQMSSAELLPAMFAVSLFCHLGEKPFTHATLPGSEDHQRDHYSADGAIEVKPVQERIPG